MTMLPTTAAADAASRTDARRRLDPRRWTLAGLGIVCVGCGGVGVFVPGLPTTVFLLIGSWCFARSCPWLERRLIRNRFFRPFLGYLEPGVRMPVRAKVIALTLMWAAVLASTFLLLQREAPTAVPLAVLLAGAIGTGVILYVNTLRAALTKRPVTAIAAPEQQAQPARCPVMRRG